MKKAILLLLLLPMLASAQYFDVFDIDTSEYPIMKAKFYSIDANGKQILNHTPADFEITENGEPRDVISVSCPTLNDEPTSIVIALDVSISMKGKRFLDAKDAVRSFIDLVPDNGTEISIIGFHNFNFYISDFTTNKNKLKSRLDDAYISNGTDFNAAFINPTASALLAMEEAQFQNKNIVIITDGEAHANQREIIDKSIELNIKIYSVVIELSVPDILSNISTQTFGRSYSNIVSKNDYLTAFSSILLAIKNSPCSLIWQGLITCKKNKNLIVRDKIIGISSAKKLNLLESQLANLEFSNSFTNFGTLNKGETKDTILTITTENYERIITNILFEPDLKLFEVLTPTPFIISKNDSIKIKIRYKSLDTSRHYSEMRLISNYCETSVGLFTGSDYLPLANKTLELIHPNGGEVFNAGDDTTITWKGISEHEEVTLKFSSNNGKKWSLISNSAIDFDYNWSVPRVQSDSCLVLIEQYTDNTDTNNKDGEIAWELIFGGSYNEEANAIVQTEDGGYIFVGYSGSKDGDLKNNSTQGRNDMLIVKIKEDGSIEWAKSYGGSDEERARSIYQSQDGGYIIAGYSASKDGDLTINGNKGVEDLWIMKLLSNGTIEWSVTYGGSDYERPSSIIQTTDGGFVVAGISQSTDGDVKISDNYGQDAWILKLKYNGEIDWSKTFGGYRQDVLSSITETFEGGLIATGHSLSYNNGNESIWLLKLRNNGETEWSRTYGGSLYERANSVIETRDGGYALAGFSTSNDEDLKDLENKGQSDAWILKLHYNGDIDWSKTFGGSDYDEANSVILTNDGDYLVTGYSSSVDGDLSSSGNKGKRDAWIFKLGNTGELKWSKTLGGSENDNINYIAHTLDGGFIVAGKSKSTDGSLQNLITNGEEDAWILKFSGASIPLQSDTSDAVFSIIMPQPVIQNNDIDMGQMIVGSTKDTIVSSVICNVGDAPLHVLGVDITDAFDSEDFLIPRGAGDFYLEKDSCQDMMFEFTPSALGSRTAVATIRTTIGDFTDTIHIRGVGINPVIEATADVVDFGVFELGKGKDTNVVLVKNVGSTDITINDTRISGPDMEQFTLLTSPISYTIAAGQEEIFELNYTAKYGGRTSSILEFHYNGIGSPLRSMLFAEGIGGEVYPQVPDAYVGEKVQLGLFLGKIKPEGLSEVATNYSATVSYNSTLLAPIDKSINVSTEKGLSFIKITGRLSGVPQIASVPMKVGLGTADRSGLVVTEFQLYDANGDSVDYDIEPGIGEFNVLGICEEGGQRLLNPDGEATFLKLLPNSTSTNITVEMTLIESGQTELTIFDQIGNKIETIYSGNPEIGTQEINLDLSQYTNGRYYIKLTTPTITKTEILEVVK